MKDITPNQRIFCDEYLKDRNGTRAYLKAYRGVKKESVAGAAAFRLLRNVKVEAYLGSRLEKLSNTAGITVDKILEEERKLAFSDARKLFKGWVTIRPDKIPDELAPAIAGIEVKETKTPAGDIETTYKYKIWDKGRSLERLEKHLGMFEKHQEAGATKVRLIRKNFDGEYSESEES